MRRLLVPVAIAAACHREPPPRPLPPTHDDDTTTTTARRPAARTASSDAPAREPAASVTTPHEVVIPESPAFLNVDADMAKVYPLRATLRRAGMMYESIDGLGRIAGEGHEVIVPVVVAEEHADSDPRRVRIVCESQTHRVAVFVDAIDLATTVRTTAIMVAKKQVPAKFDELVPGVRLRPGGTIAVLERAADGRARVRHRGLFVRADGWIDGRLLDIVHEDPPWPYFDTLDAEIVGSARIVDAPGGRVLARIEKRAKVTNVLEAETLGARSGRWTLVRYPEEGSVTVGWIERGRLRMHAPLHARPGGLALVANHPSPPQQVEVARGTWLVGEQRGELIGVVRETARLPCISACDSTEPHLEVDACTATIPVQARRPE